MPNRNFWNESILPKHKRSKHYFSHSHVQAVAAKAAKQKDRQQNFGSKTRYDNLNSNQVYFNEGFLNDFSFFVSPLIEQNFMDFNYLYVT
jgi:hypothetical protein